MTVTISKDLRELAEKLHETTVEGTRPFIEREGRSYVRFNKITLESPRAGQLMATYWWDGVPLVHLYMATADVYTQTVTLSGMTGEMEVWLR